MPYQANSRLRYFLVMSWIGLTVALSAWWMVFGLRQTEQLQALNSETAHELARHQRMLLSEGSMLIALVLAGGIAILYFMAHERRHHEQVRQFFATYTHDFKTSLASLRLQAETLQEDLSGSAHDRIIARLVKDTVRLEVQLENSLYIANQNAELFLESLRLSRTLANFRDYWPEVEISVVRDCEIRADSRALESVLKNIIQNAVQHGGSTRVTLTASQSNDLVLIRIEDNGSGFKGERERLGQLFVRHNSRSGSGVGLWLAEQLVRKMGGELRVETTGSFVVEVALQGVLV